MPPSRRFRAFIVQLVPDNKLGLYGMTVLGVTGPVRLYLAGSVTLCREIPTKLPPSSQRDLLLDVEAIGRDVFVDNILGAAIGVIVHDDAGDDVTLPANNPFLAQVIIELTPALRPSVPGDQPGLGGSATSVGLGNRRLLSSGRGCYSSHLRCRRADERREYCH